MQNKQMIICENIPGSADVLHPRMLALLCLCLKNFETSLAARSRRRTGFALMVSLIMERSDSHRRFSSRQLGGSRNGPLSTDATQP